MASLAHYTVEVNVVGAVDAVWSIGALYSSPDEIGERAACKRAREEAADRNVKLGRVSAAMVNGRWEVTAEAL